MKKLPLILALCAVCSMTSCVSVGLNDETAQKVDSVVEQMKRFNDSLEAYRKDLAELIKYLRQVFGGPPPAPTKPDGQ